MREAARARQKMFDGYIDVTDPRYSALLDRQWDNWLGGTGDRPSTSE